ncbi:hypothetical protein TSAR_003997 [Trichomalopsis sarcophagae]|uniref:Uncharacterized protein n=1 Tax=Trichomalopsis sarcophagae TaxID=543379 RepID=A0A232EE97_9HYME|nr:hypothetical protein TSAR_003997 [Trichomalopsis sarcophagae]
MRSDYRAASTRSTVCCLNWLLVNLNFDEYKNCIATSSFYKHHEYNKPSFVINVSNVSEEMYELLDNHCNIDHLTVDATSSFHKHHEYNNPSFVINASNASEEMYELLDNHCNIDHLTVDGELNKMSKISYEWGKESANPSIVDSIQLKNVNESSPLPHWNGSLTPENDILVFGEEMYELLDNHCNIDHLTVDGELNKMSKISYEWGKESADPSIIDSIQLKSVKNTMRIKQLQNHQVYAKYRSEKRLFNFILYFNSSSLPHLNGSLTPENDILVFVGV